MVMMRVGSVIVAPAARFQSASMFDPNDALHADLLRVCHKSRDRVSERVVYLTIVEWEHDV